MTTSIGSRMAIVDTRAGAPVVRRGRMYGMAVSGWTPPGHIAKHADRLRLAVGLLNAAPSPRDLGLPGLDLHELQGTRQGTWAVKVSGNWRVTFGFSGKDAQLVDYEDYH